MVQGRLLKPTHKAEEPLDMYLEWIEKLKRASKSRIVLVKHKSDADVLQSLGVKNLIYYTEPEEDLIQRIVGMKKECLLLIDADRPNNELSERIESRLQQEGIKVNTRFRKILFLSPFRELSGLLAYVHKHLTDTPRKHFGQL